MTSPQVDVAIVGAGPFGLSIAAHLQKTSLTFRIFGTPMQSWREQMPKTMLLKSDGFASSLYDPGSTFTLRHYCEENHLPYADVGIPVPSETFVAYGIEFQKRFVPSLEQTNINSVRRYENGFQLTTDDQQVVFARRVVVAAGITHFGYLPPFLAALPRARVTHSSNHHDFSRFRGQRVAVVGAGASAVDIAAILNESEAHVELIGRRRQIAFHSPSQEPRPLLQRLMNPRTGLGLGWKSKLCTDAPLLFHSMPHKVRSRAVARHLGPAPGWFVRDKVIGKFPMHLGSTIEEVKVEGEEIHIKLTEENGQSADLVFDHVIGATGFRPSISRLSFLDQSLRQEIRTVDDSPVLSKSFESSVPGLYLVGVVSANAFGPLTRFAFGAKFTAKRLSRHLATTSQSRSTRLVPSHPEITSQPEPASQAISSQGD